MGVILLITSIGMWWCPSCCLIPRNWISCEDPSTFFCLIVKPAHRRIWIIPSPFVKTSLAVSPHAKMSSIYSVCSGALHCSSAVGINPWQIFGLYFHPGGRRFQVYWAPLQVKANRGLHSAARRMEKKTLAMSIVEYYLAAFYSNSYWSSSISGTAILSRGMTSFRPQ